MTAILTIIGIIILVCCFGVLSKVAGWVLSLVWTMFGWAFDGCLGGIIIVIILLFFIGAIII